jgi:hypothetical protein
MNPKQALAALGHHAEWLVHATPGLTGGTHRIDVDRLDGPRMFDLARLGLEGWLVGVRAHSGRRIRVLLTPPAKETPDA